MDAVKHKTTDLFIDDCRLEELKVQLPSPESSQFKLRSIDFEKVTPSVLPRFKIVHFT